MDKQPLAVLIIGAGFGGIGMAVALKQAGVRDFLVLERERDVGGVWRDNTYPGAACDVPSHLYSFSFEPNPHWSRTFASRDEIHAYLRHCAAKYALAPYLRLGSEVAGARFDEAASLWCVTLRDGSEMRARVLVTATGQLSNPLLPAIDGIASFRGPAFHSARWDHGVDLAGKRVAVIGTGASATQFVPAIAPKVASLTVFQRSASYLIPRPDRPYARWQQALFRASPLAMRLHRGFIYTVYESRALAFTRAKWMLQVAVGRPFRKMLRQQVPDGALRARLTPDYPIGCKRILLSSDYLATFQRANVGLVAEKIARVTENAIETVDGRRYEADVIVYGTGFAATRFLSPMRILGRGGLDLNEAWRGGASAYLGASVPGFPNFFMLYGPNTNLGHNSIVYMLESQIAHVMRALRAMRAGGATEVEVLPGTHRAFDRTVQSRLAQSAWTGCRSWYLDERGRNTANWPGFSLSYRWLAKRSQLSAYRFTRPEPEAGVVHVMPPPGLAERFFAAQNRLLLRRVFRPLVGPPLNLTMQRRVAAWLSGLMPASNRATRTRTRLGGVDTELVAPAGQGNAGPDAGAILYLHGGAFCLGSPTTHRSLTTRLALAAGAPVWVPDYRLAPEHPYPAAVDDVVSCFDALLAQGLAPERIVVMGDSAGGALALALVLRLRALGRALPAGVALLSPALDWSASDPGVDAMAARDPMLRRAWLQQAVAAYACPPDAPEHQPLTADLAGVPELFIQAGTDEILLADSVRLAARARECGVPCRFEVYEQRWHVFQLQAWQLAGARAAIEALGRFAQARFAAAPGVEQGGAALGAVEPQALDTAEAG